MAKISLKTLLQTAERSGSLPELPSYEPEDVIAVSIESPESILEICTHGSRRRLRPLAKREMLVWFDTEGNFFREGAHARLLEYLLGRIGVEGRINDHWLSGRGWLFDLEIEGQKSWYLTEDKADHPSDYAQMASIVVLANVASAEAQSPWRFVNLRTGDQSGALALVPTALEQEFREVLPVAEPGGSRPSAISSDAAEALLERS